MMAGMADWWEGGLAGGRQVGVMRCLTMELPEDGGTHELQESVSVETGPVNRHGVLKHSQSRQ